LGSKPPLAFAETHDDDTLQTPYFDFEAGLAIVIGTRCRNVAPEDVRSVIAGYMVANDVSVRDWQMRSPTFTLGKSFDTHGPIGPWITMDEGIADQIFYISQVFTLMPGDALLTGTPSGTGIETDTYLRRAMSCRSRLPIWGISKTLSALSYTPHILGTGINNLLASALLVVLQQIARSKRRFRTREVQYFLSERSWPQPLGRRGERLGSMTLRTDH
tara:strand:+ start:601 stop:1251 length:651 start_codon:yes stop_codon:yes gene_type:complete